MNMIKKHGMIRTSLVIVSLMLFSMVFASCSLLTNTNTDRENPTAAATVKRTPTPTPTPAPTLEPTQEESPDIDTSGDSNSYFADNRYILAYIAKFSNFAPGLGLDFNMDMFSFTDNNIRTTEYGRVTNVGFYCEEDDQVMVGMGYNMDDEDMWYVSFEAPLPDLSEWYQKYFFASILALNNNPIPIADNEDDLGDFMETLYSALTNDGKDKAIQIGDYIFTYKNTSVNRAIFAVDTPSHFDAFYKGSIELITLD